MAQPLVSIPGKTIQHEFTDDLMYQVLSQNSQLIMRKRALDAFWLCIRAKCRLILCSLLITLAMADSFQPAENDIKP